IGTNSVADMVKAYPSVNAQGKYVTEQYLTLGKFKAPAVSDIVGKLNRTFNRADLHNANQALVPLLEKLDQQAAKTFKARLSRAELIKRVTGIKEIFTAETWVDVLRHEKMLGWMLAFALAMFAIFRQGIVRVKTRAADYTIRGQV